MLTVWGIIFDFADVLETPERALATMESLMYACLDPSKNSRILAKNLVTALDGVAPIHEPKEFFEAGTRYINGHQMCDEVGLGRPSLYCTSFLYFYKPSSESTRPGITHKEPGDIVIRGIIWGLMATCYTTRGIPAADRWMMRTFRALFWDYIVEHQDGLQGGLKYDLQYVPQLDAQTGVEKGEAAATPRRGPLLPPPLELLGLASFGLTVVTAAALMCVVGGAALQTLKSCP